MRASLNDGKSQASMLGFGESYLGAFGIFLKATTLQVGLLATLPQLLGSVMQWAGAINMDRLRSRRKAVSVGAYIQGLTFIPMAFLPFLFNQGNLAIPFLLLLLMVYHGANGAVIPAWNSLIGDLVPNRTRGRFFGQRNMLTGLSTFIGIVLGGLTLDYFNRQGMGGTGYFIIFLAAFIARSNSVRWLMRYDDPDFSISQDQVFSFRQFIKRSPYSNFAKFVFFVGIINLGVAFSSPYFALYMLRDLQFTYIEFTIVTAVSTVTQFLTFRYWGNLSDRFGNKKILNLCGWGIAIVPILWLFSSNIFYLMLIQVYGGLTWSGFSLATSNFLFDAVTPPKRARCVAYQGLVNGVFIFLGSLMGGYAAGHLPKSIPLGFFAWEPAFILPVVFLISGFIRLVAAIIFLKKFREVRPVEPIGHGELIFRVSHIRPIAGATFSLMTGLFQEHRQGERDKNDRKNRDT